MSVGRQVTHPSLRTFSRPATTSASSYRGRAAASDGAIPCIMWRDRCRKASHTRSRRGLIARARGQGGRRLCDRHVRALRSSHARWCVRPLVLKLTGDPAFERARWRGRVGWDIPRSKWRRRARAAAAARAARADAARAPPTSSARACSFATSRRRGASPLEKSRCCRTRRPSAVAAPARRASALLRL